MKNVIHKPLIKPSKVLFPPLHVKMELMKNFLKALDVKGPGFTYVLVWKIPQAHLQGSKGRRAYWSSNQKRFLRPAV